MRCCRRGGRRCWTSSSPREYLQAISSSACALTQCNNSNWNFTAPIAEMIALQRDMTDKYIPALKQIAPDSGAYLNEVSSHQRREDEVSFC